MTTYFKTIAKAIFIPIMIVLCMQLSHNFIFPFSSLMSCVGGGFLGHLLYKAYGKDIAQAKHERLLTRLRLDKR